MVALAETFLLYYLKDYRYINSNYSVNIVQYGLCPPVTLIICTSWFLHFSLQVDATMYFAIRERAS